LRGARRVHARGAANHATVIERSPKALSNRIAMRRLLRVRSRKARTEHIESGFAPKSGPPISYLCGHQRPKTVGCVLQLWKRKRQSRSTASPMEWRAPRASGALHLSALDLPRYYSPLGGSSGAAGGCRIGRGRCPSAPWPRRHHA
jgi:hypothetical protein